MALEAGNLSLFGFDLRRIGQLWRNGWNEAFRWPALAWLSPPEAVRVLLPGGGEVLRLGASARSAPVDAKPTSVAVVLPEESVLLRELRLPPLAGDELAQAVEFEVLAVSPFPQEQTAWGFDAQAGAGQVQVRLALAAQAHVVSALESAQPRASADQPEVWADAADPIVLRGFGESLRFRRERAARRRILLALGGLVFLLMALAATPVLQARQQVFDAQRRYGGLEGDVAEVVAARNALVVGTERIQAIRTHLAEHPDLPVVLERLTELLPDDAFLTRLEVQGRQVRIVGQARDAAQLMRTLGTPESPFRNVRAPSPISRAGRSDKENFVIEFVVADVGSAS